MKKSMLVILLISCLFLNAGCQNKRELSDLGIVLGMALDRGEKEPIKLTVQVAKPGQMKGGEEGGGKGGGGKGGSSVLLLSGEGKTLFDAVRNLALLTSKKLFFSHNQVTIIGEELAKSGLQQVVDMLERDNELRVEVPLLIAKGQAGRILELTGSFEKMSAVGINKTLETAEFSGRSQKTHLYNFVRDTFKEDYAPVVPGIEVVRPGGVEMPKISGFAVFKNGKLTGWLDETESRGYLWVKGKVKSGIIVVNPGKPGTVAALEIKEVGSKVESKIMKGKPSIAVKVKETSNIGEIEGPLIVTKPENLELLEKKQDKVIADEIKLAVTKAQKMKADIFGFGEELHRNHPKLWKPLKSTWDKIFPELKINISVESNIQDFGDKTDPTFAHKGGK